MYMYSNNFRAGNAGTGILKLTNFNHLDTVNAYGMSIERQ